MGLMARIYVLIALAVVPGFALLAYIHYQDYQRHQAAAEEEALRSARLVAAEFEQMLDAAGYVLSAAAAAPAVTSLQEPGCSAYLQRLQDSTPIAGTVAVAAADGTIRCGGMADISIGDRAYFQQALGSEGAVIGEYVISRASGVPVLPLAKRIETPEGPAVIAIGLTLDSIREHFAMRYSQFPPESSLTIIDRQGTILVRLPNREREGRQLSRFQFLVESKTGGTFRSTAENTADGVARFVGFTSPHEAPAAGFSVAVGIPQAPLLAQSREQALRNYLLLGLIALLASVAAALGGRLFIHRPVRHLLAVIAAWRSGHQAARTSPQALPREFAQIGGAFNDMAADLEAALQHKEMLLRELNHRVMNSLATVSSLLKMEARGITSADSRQRFERAASRMEALALVYKRMQASEGVEAIDFAAFLQHLCHDLHTSMMSPATPCLVEADSLRLPPAQATPLALIVNELVTNALKHGLERAGPVRVTLRRSDDTFRLTVRNPGELPAGFDPARTGGFGMKMVATMVQQIQGELSATTTAGEAVFSVTFTPAIPQAVLSQSPDAAVAAATEIDNLPQAARTSV